MGPPLFERVSKSHFEEGMWQLLHAILPFSPIAPSCPSASVPPWIAPEIRGSKKIFCPSKAAAAESRYLFVVSTGGAGKGESVCRTDNSSGEKLTSPADCPHPVNAVDANKTAKGHECFC